MFKLATIFLCFASSDSIPPQQVVKDSIPPSVVFVSNIDLSKVPKIPYKHQQGFFCDFEDKINYNRKLLLNIGVGNQ